MPNPNKNNNAQPPQGVQNLLNSPQAKQAMETLQHMDPNQLEKIKQAASSLNGGNLNELLQNPQKLQQSLQNSQLIDQIKNLLGK